MGPSAENRRQVGTARVLRVAREVDAGYDAASIRDDAGPHALPECSLAFLPPQGRKGQGTLSMQLGAAMTER